MPHSTSDWLSTVLPNSADKQTSRWLPDKMSFFQMGALLYTKQRFHLPEFVISGDFIFTNANYNFLAIRESCSIDQHGGGQDQRIAQLLVHMSR